MFQHKEKGQNSDASNKRVSYCANLWIQSQPFLALQVSLGMVVTAHMAMQMFLEGWKALGVGWSEGI